MTTNSPNFIKEVETTALLKNKMENDTQFIERFIWVRNFYWYKVEKFKSLAISEEEVFEKYSQFMQQLFHSGYHLMCNFLEGIKEETEALDELKDFFLLSPSNLRNELPMFVKEVFGENWSVSHGSDYFLMWLVKNVTFPTPFFIEQIRQDIIMEGFYQALLYSPLYKGKELPVEAPFHIAHPAELPFVTPQVFLMSNGKGRDFERWSIHFWSNNKMGNREIGSILLLSEQQKDDVMYILYVMLDNIVVEEEKTVIIGAIVEKLPKEILKNLVIPYYSVTNVTLLHPNLDDVEKE